MALPTIIFVHGAWHFGGYFDKVQAILESKGYKCVALEMPAVGRSPPVKSLDEDIETVRNAVLKELEAGNDVQINSHSWGGIPTCSALDGLSKVERTEQGHATGVTKLTFVSAFALLEGMSINGLNEAAGGSTETVPWLDFLDDGNIMANDVYNIFYHDIDPIEAEKYISKLKPHSLATFADTTRSAAWRKIPSAYLICENDRSVPVLLQEMLIENIRKEGGVIDTERLASAHSPYVKDPEFVAGFIERAATQAV